VASGMWVGSHEPIDGGLSLKQTSRPVEHWLGVPEECRPGGVKIVHVC
jgi:hypothetical protein